MQRADLVNIAREVQRLPYQWPAPPDAASTERAGAGTCAGKHALLSQRLKAVGISTRPLLIVGPLAPPMWSDLVEESGGLVEVHECLTVLTSWAGPLLVDVTWHPAAVAAGLPGMPTDWNGCTDTPTAVAPIGPGYAVSREELRTWKEALRTRLYSPEHRKHRDLILAEVARRAGFL